MTQVTMHKSNNKLLNVWKNNEDVTKSSRLEVQKLETNGQSKIKNNYIKHMITWFLHDWLVSTGRSGGFHLTMNNTSYNFSFYVSFSWPREVPDNISMRRWHCEPASDQVVGVSQHSLEPPVLNIRQNSNTMVHHICTYEWSKLFSSRRVMWCCRFGNVLF